jgi:hypothetical protein
MNDPLPAVSPQKELDNGIGSPSVEGCRVTCSPMHGRAIMHADPAANAGGCCHRTITG